MAVRLSTAEAQEVLRRFGAVPARETGESNWIRPDPGNPRGSANIVISRDRNPLGAGVTKSIIRHAKVDRDEFWAVAANPDLIPPIRTTREGLGLSDEQLAEALRADAADVAAWCAGNGGPAGAAVRRLADLESLRTSALKGSARWPIWRWLHSVHPNLRGRTPRELLGQLNAISDLGQLDDKSGRMPPQSIAAIL